MSIPMESGFKVLFCLLKFQTRQGNRSDMVDPKYVCMFYALCDYVSFNSFGVNLITHNTWIVGILFPNYYKITWQTSKQLSLLKGIGSNLDLNFPCIQMQRLLNMTMQIWKNKEFDYTKSFGHPMFKSNKVMLQTWNPLLAFSNLQ